MATPPMGSTPSMSAITVTAGALVAVVWRVINDLSRRPPACCCPNAMVVSEV